ncbi:hypothetical protein [Psychrobacillus antarcticus]|uniref:hypothetical protein n=1 Tax=Psychrobacillus antarcticus TaxID=2879115 RepID=UPI002408840F|nr:hypothetical protein [Psychrobacillus antarcticus]
MELKGSLYDELPSEMLAGFYYYINLNIDKGILSDAMHSEIKLIEGAAKTRGIPLEELYEQGSTLVKIEKEKQGQEQALT